MVSDGGQEETCHGGETSVFSCCSWNRGVDDHVVYGSGVVRNTNILTEIGMSRTVARNYNQLFS